MKKEFLFYIRRRLWIILLLPASYIIYQLAFLFPQITEAVYSRGIYPFFATIYSWLTSLLPFSLGEIGLYCFIACVLFYLVFIPLGFCVKGKRLYTAAKRLVSFICIICIVGSSFILNWAINYARTPLAGSMGYKTDTYSAEELKEVTEILIERCNTLREQVTEDEDGIFILSSSRKDILEELPNVYAESAIELLYPVKSGARAKGVMAKDLLSTFETTGIFSPFTYEANVNMQMHQLTFPVTAAHEYAHLQGFAREDEANFIAWYVARGSSNTDFAYSAYILALIYALNSLYSTSKEYHSEVYYTMCDGTIRDLRSYREYWDEFDTELSEQASEIYSDYLKASGVSDGNKSYGRMLDLILAMHRAGDTI